MEFQTSSNSHAVGLPSVESSTIGRFCSSVLRAAGVLLLITPTIAFAASDGHAGSHHQPSILDLSWFYANFALYCLLMFLLLRKLVSQGWGARRERIASGVEQGTRAAASARKKVAEAHARLTAVESEIESIEGRIMEETAAETRKVIEDAHARGRAIVTQASLLAQSEQKAVESKMRREFAESIIEEARRRVQAVMSPAVDSKLRERVLSHSAEVIH